MRPRQRNYGCRINSYTIEGLRAFSLENRWLRVAVLADKGADIYEFLYKPRDVDFLWRTPNGIVNPSLGTPSIATSAGAFMDTYEGGWQELFPTLGRPTQYNGAEFGNHGEVALLPWDCSIVRDDPDGIVVVCEVRCRRSPFRLRRSVSILGDAPALYIEEELQNEGAQALQFMWGHHPVLGAPFLQPGCLLSLPGGLVHPMRLDDDRFRASAAATPWPMYRPDEGYEEDLRYLPTPHPRFVDEFYVSDLPEGWWAMTNPHLGVGFALRWDKRIFPYLWLWRTLGPSAGYPWYGGTYTLGLEPFSSVPPHFDDSRERSTTLSLAASESVSTSLVAVAFEGEQSVGSVSTEGGLVLSPR